MGLSIKTKEYTLRHEKYPHVLKGYNNTNWNADFEESKSTSRYIFTFRDAIISWKSFKQTCIARSTIELKFVALDKAE